MKRSIILFPKLKELQAIQNIREKYDPLAKCIAPHITIVFPFESNISTKQLKEHITLTLEEINKFEVELRDITGDFASGYLFLNIKKGNDQIIELHDKLYKGILKDFLYRKLTYFPHLTVGAIEDGEKFNNTLNELSSFNKQFITVIDEVYVEMIDEKENSIIEFSVNLK